MFFLFNCLISCDEKAADNELWNVGLAFELDTVMIDPGNELLHLNAGLRMAALDAERDYL